MTSSSSSSSSAAADAGQWIDADPSTLCSLGPRPLLMTGVLVNFLRNHFADPVRNAHQERFRKNLWTADVSASQIYIESITNWLPDSAHKRPALVVKRNAWQCGKWGLNDELMSTIDADGLARFEVPLFGSHTIFALAKTGGECEILANEVATLLIGFQGLLREKLSLNKFQFVEIGPVNRVARVQEVTYGAPITVSYAGVQEYILAPHAPLVSRIRLDVLLQP